ncbi:MAG: TPM domain-containing protein [Candidatus Contendobacter sp.]
MASISLWLQRGRRLLAHRCRDRRDIHTALSPAALERLAARVAASEQRHVGELRICIEAGLPWSYIQRDAAARDRALTLFGKLRVWDTEHNNGVLVYLLLAEHAIELIADRGLNVRASPEQWVSITTELGNALANGQAFEESLNQAVDALTQILVAHFPRDSAVPKVNQLPDAPVVLI